MPTSDYTGLNEGVYLQPGLGTSASAPVLPSELPPSEVAAPAGAAVSGTAVLAMVATSPPAHHQSLINKLRSPPTEGCRSRGAPDH